MPFSPTLVHAGPLTAVFERVGLRWISHGQSEVLRSIHCAVRDATWRTIPAEVSGLTIDRGEDAFRIEFDARHVDGSLDFAWHGTIDGRADGTLEYRMDGEARTTFARNRIGLCVLHPIAAWIDRPHHVEHTDGSTGSLVWPADVSPHQVARDVRLLRHDLFPGLAAEVRLSGEVFETEDQRNWSDASFKTYGTPVDLPLPVIVEAGTRIAQTATLRFVATPTVAAPDGEGPVVAREQVNEARRRIWLLPSAGGLAPGDTPSPTDPVRLELTVETRPLPRVGVSLPPGAPTQTPAVRARLAALRLGHLRVTLDLSDAGWALDFERAASEAGYQGVPLEVAVMTTASKVDDELEALSRATLRIGPLLSRWMVFDKATGTTPAVTATLARRHLRPVAPDVPIGGGSDKHFAELNRNRPPVETVDFLVYGATPQAHDTDEATIMEAATSVGDVHRTIRGFARWRPIVVSPVTLQPRPSVKEDPRQAAPFAAVWIVAHLSALVEHGTESVTYFETVGPAGVLSPAPTEERPVARVLAAAGAFRGASARLLRSSDPEAVAALGLTDGRRAQILVANLRAIETQVILPGERTAVRLEPHGILSRDLGRSLAAR